MKKLLTLALFAVSSVLTVNAQGYRSERLGFTRSERNFFNENCSYFGVRLGPSFSSIDSDDAALDGNKMKAGLNVGFVAGIPLTQSAPLYFETGLSYTEKGGEGKFQENKMKYNLDYIEMPLLFKYRCNVYDKLSIEPFAGGYLGVGIAGKIKDYGTRTAYESFGSDDVQFKRFDGGVKVGCGISYDMLYIEVAYDWGLANTCHDDFDASHNKSLLLNVGINF